MLETAFSLADDWGKQHQLAAEREFHHLIYDVLDATPRDLTVTDWTMRYADPSEEKTKIIIDFGNRGYGRTGVATGGLLVDRDGRR